MAKKHQFVNMRTIQQMYRQKHGIKTGMAGKRNNIVFLDNGRETELQRVYLDGRIQTTSGDVYDGLSKGRVAINLSDPFHFKRAIWRLKNMGFTFPKEIPDQ